ncbi:MAG TPA: penicillin-binding protein 2 [Candidatus Marinimicrobia bacterium]|jgi:penicillin-binding protein 2|nr:penicillin-binding protein 2 [Candidatus Neomarinimicrobiota bacterium]|tara:strand:- start:2432 stop:4156 length:1725 start_codon:yes stop_codon:yes gene_type:complete
MPKFKKVQLVLAGIFAILFFRFYHLQIYQHSKYETKAGNNSVRKISLHAPRGIIYDRNGIPIVDNRQIYDLSVIPFDVTNQFDYRMVSKRTGVSSIELKEKIAKGKKSFHRFRPIPIKRHINFETRSHLEENKLSLPGTIFSEFPARTYPVKAKLTHVLGYLRAVTELSVSIPNQELDYKLGDVFGFSGIERIYESILRGRDGTEFRLVDIYGIDHGVYQDNPGLQPTPGKALNLSIDSELQALIEDLFRGKKGAAICMMPQSGEVLAFVSAPDYDLNSFAGPVPIELWERWNTDPERPLLNRGIQGLYPPGSTFKLIGAALAKEESIVDKNWTVNCNGVYHLGDRDFHCWNNAGHGIVNMDKAIFQSCNIYFYHLIQKLSFNNWKAMAENFGFGATTGIDLLGEKGGLVPGKKYMNKKYGRYGWATGNLLTFIIGQGDILVTPIQVAQMMSIIATRGNTKTPHLLVDSPSENIIVSLKSTTWDFLQQATWNVVNHEDGTGKAAKVLGGEVHGKTGTAQNPHGENHSWFAGYLVKDGVPILSLAILVEHGGKGSVEAALISHKIFKYAQKNITL